MGFIKQSVIFCFLLVLFSYLKSFLEPKLPVVFDGYYHPAFKNVADKFKANLESGKERGGAFAVYHKGRLVIDIWGGYADEEAQRPWQRDTMTLGFSTTKGVAAVLVATMADKGLINYKSLVSDYWPEFENNDKGNITVEMLLSHQAGLVALDEPISLFDVRDHPDKVEKSLSSQRTLWPAGSSHGYHALTYGPYVDTLIRKVDPKGRSTEKVFREDIAKPFDIDMFMNAPREEYYRVARIYGDPAWKMLLKSLTNSMSRSLIFKFMMNPDALIARSARAVTEFTKGSCAHNNPYYREIPMSCCYATGTARGFAKIYGILGNGGIEGKQRLLSEDAIRKLATPLISGVDETIGFETIVGPGTTIRLNPRGEDMIGHTGNGGQFAMVDLKHNLGIGYLTNFMSIHGFGDDPRYLDLENELYRSLDNYIDQEGLK